MRVEPKALVRRLTPTATRQLETAVGRASNGRFYEIVPEHLLQVMLEEEGSDSARLLRHCGVDRQQLAVSVERVLQKLRAGSSGRPVFSENLFQWLEDAWLVASVERGATRLRTGELLLQFIVRRARYTDEALPALDAISPASVARTLEEVLGDSPESAELQSDQGSPSAGAGPGAAARGERALERFATSFTEKARAGQIDPIFGRHREVRQVIDILARRRKNNPIIVGEPGVGKTALVEGLALAIVAGDVPDSLRTVEVLGLDLGLLQAGASVKGEFENRLKAVISEVKASATPIILFIDEAHTLIGAGGPSGGSDAANLLKPALARGELRTIAATTWSEYKKYFEKDAALERRFQPVKVDEPSEEDAVLMIRGLRPTYEKAHAVFIRDEAVVAAVRLSHRYLSGRQLPDKAIDLLDTAAARVKLELASRPDELVALESQIAGVEREKEARLREEAHGGARDAKALGELEQKLAALKDRFEGIHARWQTERDAVLALKSARESGASADEIARATAAVEACGSEDRLVHGDVDADVVARVIASWTGVPVGKLRGEAIGAALTLEEKLSGRVRGQTEAIRSVAEVIRVSTAGIRNPDAPIGVLLFVGPSGVGKTETALALADALYGGERFMTTINMSEFQEKHSVSRLIGSPPGYVGFGEGGMLTEAVRQRPYSVVLLDECEKADLEVMNLFYQVFDKGVLTDSEGRAVDFRNTVVILTSNLGSDIVSRLFEDGAVPDASTVTQAIRPVLSRHFKPALLARMTIVPFAPIQGDTLKEIVEMRLSLLASRLSSAHGIKTRFAPEVVDALARRCTEGETGARNVDHVLRSSLTPLLARSLLEHLSTGHVPPHLEVGLGTDGAWQLRFENP